MNDSSLKVEQQQHKKTEDDVSHTHNQAQLHFSVYIVATED